MHMIANVITKDNMLLHLQSSPVLRDGFNNNLRSQSLNLKATGNRTLSSVKLMSLQQKRTPSVQFCFSLI